MTVHRLLLDAQKALEACFEEMTAINEDCDHSVGICWCSYHRAMEQAKASIDAIQSVREGKTTL